MTCERFIELVLSDLSAAEAFLNDGANAGFLKSLRDSSGDPHATPAEIAAWTLGALEARFLEVPRTNSFRALALERAAHGELGKKDRLSIAEQRWMAARMVMFDRVDVGAVAIKMNRKLQNIVSMVHSAVRQLVRYWCNGGMSALLRTPR